MAKFYSDEEVVQLLREHQNSNAYTVDFANAKGVNHQTFYGWLKSANLVQRKKPRSRRDWDKIRNSL